MTKEAKAYKRFYYFVRFVLSFVYRFKIVGRENLQKLKTPAAMVCANHSSFLDPFFAGMAFGKDNNLRMMGKKEIFEVPIAGAYFKHIGMFPVMRGERDIKSIRNVMTFLKNGEKVLIFPEGTRVSEGESVEAKRGALRLADRAGVPVIPLYIPRKKPIFHKMTLAIGEPYYINESGEKMSNADYIKAADVVMERIAAIGARAEA